MIRAASIYGFRGFLKVEIEDLARFNVVVGPNATGKTALLEALFLASGGSPEVSLRLRVWRGMAENIQISTDKSSFEALWKDLFFGQEIRPISITLRDSERGQRVLRIGYRTDPEISLPLGRHAIQSAAIQPLRFEWEAEGKVYPVDVQIVPDKGLVLGIIPSVLQSVFIHAAQKASPHENAARYSDLSQANRERGVLEALQKVYPFVRGLSVEIAGSPALYALVEGLEAKLPLPMISAGVNRYVSIILAIQTVPGGIVLIDELENGFYHAAMQPLLRSILDEATQNECQLFATVHSMECLNALSGLVENAPNEFRLLRTRRKNGQCEIVQVPGTKFSAALQEGFEIR